MSDKRTNIAFTAAQWLFQLAQDMKLRRSALKYGVALNRFIGVDHTGYLDQKRDARLLGMSVRELQRACAALLAAGHIRHAGRNSAGNNKDRIVERSDSSGRADSIGRADPNDRRSPDSS